MLLWPLELAVASAPWLVSLLFGGEVTKEPPDEQRPPTNRSACALPRFKGLALNVPRQPGPCAPALARRVAPQLRGATDTARSDILEVVSSAANKMLVTAPCTSMPGP